MHRNSKLRRSRNYTYKNNSVFKIGNRNQTYVDSTLQFERFEIFIEAFVMFVQMFRVEPSVGGYTSDLDEDSLPF